ncbi:glycerate kinase-like [Gigantopelta aegis]|uniref:glycerate kinase-like n=1 Tax=Gigantopelta aegis TaxID=1735272 RepID=UPI001B88C0F1|nr:glycerate kinase-like [Gigantopelta aegis]
MVFNCIFRLPNITFGLLERSLPLLGFITKHRRKIHHQALLGSNQSFTNNFLLTHHFSAHPARSHCTMHNHSTTVSRSFDVDTRSIFLNAIESVLPRQMLQTVLRYSWEKSTLVADDREYCLDNNVYVVGFGKAVCGMARVVEDIIGEHINTGIISIPHGAVDALHRADKLDMLLKTGSKIKIYEGARNNLPDTDSVKAAQEIHSLVSSLKKTDIVIVLISGGGSSLLPMPCDPITLTDIMQLTSLMSRGGATIHELNVVRRNTEVLKGGGLAQAAHPTQIISLIVSDAIGNSLDDIASGPTVPNCSHPSQCFEIFNRLGIMEEVPQRVVTHLRKQIKTQNAASRDPKEILSSGWKWVHNILVGSNVIATSAATKKSEALRYTTYTLSNSMDGEAKEVAAMFAKLACFISLLVRRASQECMAQLRGLELDLVQAGIKKTTINEIVNITEKAKNSSKPVCIISGGETIVHVRGSGIGGRSQEMVLAAAIHLDELFADYIDMRNHNVSFFSGGTDGQDGMTDAAGAIVNAHFVAQTKTENLSLKAYLDNNDSYSVFSKVQNGIHLVKTGLTGTNVMDIQILMVDI